MLFRSLAIIEKNDAAVQRKKMIAHTQRWVSRNATAQNATINAVLNHSSLIALTVNDEQT